VIHPKSIARVGECNFPKADSGGCQTLLPGSLFLRNLDPSGVPEDFSLPLISVIAILSAQKEVVWDAGLRSEHDCASRLCW
jgi:hypothetical protein